MCHVFKEKIVERIYKLQRCHVCIERKIRQIVVGQQKCYVCIERKIRQIVVGQQKNSYRLTER